MAAMRAQNRFRAGYIVQCNINCAVQHRALRSDVAALLGRFLPNLGRPSGRPLFLARTRRGRGLQWKVDSPAPKVRMTAPSFPPSAHQHCSAMFFLLFVAGLWAGAQNALAGGGSFVTLPALVLAGLDPRAANITSTVALFPGQVTSGMAARSLVSGAQHLSFRALFAIASSAGRSAP